MQSLVGPLRCVPSWTLVFGCLFNLAFGASSASVESDILDIVQQPRWLASQWGLSVRDARSGDPVLGFQEDKVFRPASNVKILTVALALERLGPGYRIPTQVKVSRPLDADGVLDGDLLVVGQGDPTFAARFHGWDYQKSTERLSRALIGAGLKRVNGDLVGDASYFDGPSYGSGWVWEDLQEYFGAEVSALSVDDNVVDLRIRPNASNGGVARVQAQPADSGLEFVNAIRTVGRGSPDVTVFREIGSHRVILRGTIPRDSRPVFDSVSVPRPEAWFLRRLRSDLGSHEVRVDGGVRIVDRQRGDANSDGRWKDLLTVHSTPISNIAFHTLKRSQNLYAQTLFLQVGAQSTRFEGLEVERRAQKEMEAFLESHKVGARAAYIEEGSGLSRRALMSPSAMTQILHGIQEQDWFSDFWRGLPIAGEDGTLAGRFRGGPAEGSVRAKTGRLAHAIALSGYGVNRTGAPFVFSIFLNNLPDVSTSQAQGDVDRIVELLVSSTW